MASFAGACSPGAANVCKRLGTGNGLDHAEFKLGMARRRLHAFFTGRVQGVGFRYTVKSLAAGFEATGTVRNLPDGRVEFLAEGEPAELEGFLQAVRESEVGRFIRHEEISWQEAAGRFRGFEIVA